MTNGSSYEAVVANLSDKLGDGSFAPVTFTMDGTLARSEFQEYQEPVKAPRQNLATGCDPALIQKAPVQLAKPRFKVEIGFTTKFNLLVCRTTYTQELNADGKVENKKDKTYTAFKSVSDARASLDPNQPADAACIYQLRDVKDADVVETQEV